MNTAPVSKRALLQRINRALREQGQMVKTLRGERWRNELGDHYLLDFDRNVIIGKHVDLVDLGKNLKVMRPWEHLAE